MSWLYPTPVPIRLRVQPEVCRTIRLNGLFTACVTQIGLGNPRPFQGEVGEKQCTIPMPIVVLRPTPA